MNPDTLLRILKTGTVGSYKVALFLSLNNQDRYSVTGEAKGPNYIPGGKLLPSPTYATTDTSASMTFTGDITWQNATIAARYAMIYNTETLYALKVIDFKAVVSSTNDTFKLSMPETPLIVWETA
jgi:hypothetical protein